MKPLIRLTGLILMMLWALTFGLVGMLVWMPLYILSPWNSILWWNWVQKTGDIPSSMFTKE